MGIAVFPAAGGGATVSDGNAAGWNLGETQWEQISEYKSASVVAAIDFTSIPQTYRSLRLHIVGMEMSTNDDVYIRINNDSTASTYGVYGRTIQSFRPDDRIHNMNSQNKIVLTPQNSVASGQAFSSFLEFPNYTTDRAKKCNSSSYFFAAGDNAVHNSLSEANFRKGTTTPAITSLRIFTNGTNMNFSSNEAAAATLWGCK